MQILCSSLCTILIFFFNFLAARMQYIVLNYKQSLKMNINIEIAVTQNLQWSILWNKMQEKKGGKGVATRTPATPPELRLMLPQSWQWTRRGQPSLCCITAGGSSMFFGMYLWWRSSSVWLWYNSCMKPGLSTLESGVNVNILKSHAILFCD